MVIYVFCLVFVPTSTQVILNLANHHNVIEQYVEEPRPRALRANYRQDASKAIEDVIKNITRVNNVLEELLTNYEKLQKLYKSQEADGTEGDDLDYESSVEYIINRGREPTPGVGTPMFLLSENENSSDDDSEKNIKDSDSDTDADTSKEKDVEKGKEDNKEEEKKKKTHSKLKTKVVKNVTNSMNTGTTSKQTKLVINILREKNDDDFTKNTSTHKKKANHLSKTKKMDITKKQSKSTSTKSLSSTFSSSKSKREKKKTIKMTKRGTYTTVKYTKILRQKYVTFKDEAGVGKEISYANDTSTEWSSSGESGTVEKIGRSRVKLVKRSQKNDSDIKTNDTQLIKSIIKAEDYPPDFWDQLVHKSPILLKTEQEITYLKDPSSANGGELVYLNENPEISTGTGALNKLKILTMDKVRQLKEELKQEGGIQEVGTFEMKSRTEDNNSSSIEDWPIEDSQSIAKEQFKTIILQKAYGDACLNVVVKKCFKALLRVPAKVCAKYPCNRNFKEDFTEFSKTGCIQEFKSEEVVEQMAKRGVIEEKIGALNESMNENLMVDTRRNFLSAACLPVPKPGSLTARRLLYSNATTESKVLTSLKLSKLRDKFEIACQKASAANCKHACYFAISQVCQDCIIRKKSALAKECRASCNKVFLYTENKIGLSASEIYTGTDSEDDSLQAHRDKDDAVPISDYQIHLKRTTTTSATAIAL